MRKQRLIYTKRVICIILVLCSISFIVNATTIEFSEIEQNISETGKDISNLTLNAVPEELMDNLKKGEENEKTIAEIDSQYADELDTINVKNTDGSFSLITFAEPVKYVNEKNEIKFIDNTLKSPDSLLGKAFSDVAFENTSNDIKVTLPKNIKQGVNTEADGYSFTMTPVTEQNSNAVKKMFHLRGIMKLW